MGVEAAEEAAVAAIRGKDRAKAARTEHRADVIAPDVAAVVAAVETIADAPTDPSINAAIRFPPTMPIRRS